MCRHLIYTGDIVNISNIIFSKKHSLIQQSFNSKELIDAKVNADGFGICWVLRDGKPKFYKNIMPIWSDIFLKNITDSISSDMIIGNVRSATPGIGYGIQNVHPFIIDDLMFSHNGYIKNFNAEVAYKLKKDLALKYSNFLKGNTDSELIFALIAQNYYIGLTLEESILKVFRKIKKICPEALLNIIVARKFNGKKEVYSSKYSIGKDAPSLYLSNSLNEIKSYAIIASEPLDKDGKWEKIKEQTLVAIVDKKINFINID